ncbi:hypothetical protein [Streptomyces sp. NPDC005423]|uniref:COG1470 family protein n=1 Tax=Streptomyces sp. NPDC005423 TaxID=3155343 RepID=UPI0033A6A121
MLPTVRVLCLSVLALLLTAPVARADDSAWSLAPAGGDRPSFYAEGAPGTVLRDTVSVVNRGAGPVTVRLRGGGLVITFAATAVRVPARTRADVPFTVGVPAGAAPGARTGTLTARDGNGRRVTVPLRLRVGGPALAALTVEHVTVRGDRIGYELVNRGTTVLVPRLAVRAHGLLGGTLLDRPPRTLPVRLPPGKRLRLTEPWPGRPALDAVGVRLTVTAAGGAHGSARVSARFVSRGATAGAGALLAVAVATALAVRGRRRRRASTGDEGEAGGAREGQPPFAEVELTGAVG